APFWGGTYFPPEPRWGRPSFRQVLEAIADAFQSGDDAVAKNAQALIDAVADRDRGGLRGAPKFPNPPIFRFLWQESHRTGDPAAAQALDTLLRAMSAGGIYDHLGGGYARYSTDAEWLAPHFEKMLYDNAQILDLLALAYGAHPAPLFAACAEETVGWLIRDMTAEANGDCKAAFAASEDADSEGEEGRFYVWSAGEIDRLLGPDARAFRAAYDVSPSGNWEGKTILRRITPP